MSPLASRRFVAALCGAAAVVVAYLVLAMPGMDHSGTATPHDDSTSHDVTELRELTVNQFADAVDDRGAVVINVHVPDEGAIAGTDLVIAFDEIADAAELPVDRDSQLLLYCQSGRMSRTAGETLIAAGYRNVAHLDGGMDAWTRAGRPLIGQPDEPNTADV